MNFHPLANLFPLLEGAELQALADDIREHGLLEAIVTFEDAILDGRNRFRACEIAGVAPRFKPFEGGDPLAYVLSLNLERRHLNESQRAMIAARLANMGRGARTDLHCKDANWHLISQTAAAARLHVSVRTVRHAIAVQKTANRDLAKAVDEGRMAVSLAARALLLPPDRQARVIENIAAGDHRAAILAVEGIDPRPPSSHNADPLEQFRLLDGRSIAEIKAGELELLIRRTARQLSWLRAIAQFGSFEHLGANDSIADSIGHSQLARRLAAESTDGDDA
jgi:hypothetical protein